MAKNLYNYDVSLRELAAIFMQKGWQYAKNSQPVAIPNPDDIHNMIKQLVAVLEENGGGYSELGRFVVWRDTEFPGGYEIALRIGYVKTNVPEDLDTPQGGGA